MRKPSPYVTRPPKRVVKKCLRIVIQEAKAEGIPPAHVTAHIQTRQAIAARKRAMLRMVTEAGLKRAQVAWAFNRDLRRVRASEIGGPRSRHGHTGPDYSKVDLFGQPLPVMPQAIHRVPYRDRYFDVVRVLDVVKQESETAARLLRELHMSGT